MPEAALELVPLAATQLSDDVVQAIKRSAESDADGSPARNVLENILQNITLAAEQSTPICQDTGTCLFCVTMLPGVSMRAVKQEISAAVAEATARSWLRPNAVHPVTGINSGDNCGVLAPQVHFEEWDEDAIKVALILKGGGSENVSTQYKLPDAGLEAGRNLDGV